MHLGLESPIRDSYINVTYDAMSSNTTFDVSIFCCISLSLSLFSLSLSLSINLSLSLSLSLSVSLFLCQSLSRCLSVSLSLFRSCQTAEFDHTFSIAMHTIVQNKVENCCANKTRRAICVAILIGTRTYKCETSSARIAVHWLLPSSLYNRVDVEVENVLNDDDGAAAGVIDGQTSMNIARTRRDDGEPISVVVEIFAIVVVITVVKNIVVVDLSQFVVRASVHRRATVWHRSRTRGRSSFGKRRRRLVGVVVCRRGVGRVVVVREADALEPTDLVIVQSGIDVGNGVPSSRSHDDDVIGRHRCFNVVVTVNKGISQSCEIAFIQLYMHIFTYKSYIVYIYIYVIYICHIYIYIYIYIFLSRG